MTGVQTCALPISVLEIDLGSELVQDDDTNQAQEIFLDTILTLKPYIFNFQTKLEHKRRTDV